MKRNVLALGLLLLPSTGWPQNRPSIRQDAKSGTCNNIVALAGNVSVNCSSLTQDQRKLIESIPDVLNKILANQLNPTAVMAKLDEIIANQKKQSETIEQIQQKTWQRLTDAELAQAASELLPFAGQKVSIVVLNPEADRTALAQQFATIFRRARWDFSGINTPLGFFNPAATEFPYGIVLHVGQITPAAQALGGVLIRLFGRLSVPDGFNDEKFAKDQIEVNIWPRAR